MSCFRFITKAKARFVFQIILSWHIVLLCLVLIFSAFFLDPSYGNQNLVMGFSILLPLTSYWLTVSSYAEEKDNETAKFRKYLEMAKILKESGISLHLDPESLEPVTKPSNFRNPTFGQGRLIFIQQSLFSFLVFWGSCIAIFLPHFLQPEEVLLYQTPGYLSLIFLIGVWFGKPKTEKKNKVQKRSHLLLQFLQRPSLDTLNINQFMRAYGR